MEGLRDFLASAIARVDEQTKQMAAPKERLMRLLKAEDKKAALLEMAGERSSPSCSLISNAAKGMPQALERELFMSG